MKKVWMCSAIVVGLFEFIGCKPSAKQTEEAGVSSAPVSAYQLGSRDFWLNGSGPGSRDFWIDEGSRGPGSRNFWIDESSSGPGSRNFWLKGTGPGSRDFWIGEGSIGPGSRNFWLNGSGPGSRDFWLGEGSSGPGSTIKPGVLVAIWEGTGFFDER